MPVSEHDEPAREPSMSVVLATVAGSSIRKTLDHLGAQTARDELEIVIVTDRTDAERILSAEDRARFACHAIVCLPEIGSKASANAEGVRRGRAPLVAFSEDHCFAEPGWAEALIRRHRDAYAAVGPRVRNANPATALSWCDLLINYGPWLEASSAGVQEGLPGHNCCYKKAALSSYDDRLAEWLAVENEMHLDMVRRGFELYLEADAVVAHVNVSRWSSWLSALFHAGRVYAAERCREWSAARRLGYTLSWPLIAGLRSWRMLVAWPANVPDLPTRTRLAPTLFAGLVVDAVGQAGGYLAGLGDAEARMLRFESGRAAHVRAAERALLEPTP